LLPILASCGFKRIATKPPSDGFVEVESVFELAQPVVNLNAQVGNTQFIVVGNSSQSQTIIALNPTCPHAGCNVEE
jgi:cytochrome b6-f complex iron-sulfur subunit